MSRSGARANRYRGEIEAVIGGERRILCLTLGALAELETAFAADGLGDLGKRLASGGLKARDLIAIIGAGLRGGGNAFDDEDVAAMSMEGGVSAYARLVAELLTVTFSGGAVQRPDGREPDPS
ncbi:gene transfer agent family protein [Martelella endophytica]|uniref:gene transfer agent family protein n=1 Tax=Martelella endophytica TaxID=1486262 RepID=UPI0005F2486F|nr:gene transfer agent family protein [Martelella endophytica]